MQLEVLKKRDKKSIEREMTMSFISTKSKSKDHHGRHALFSKLSELIEFRQDNFAKIRPIFFPHFSTLEGKLGEMQGMFQWPVLNSGVKHLSKSAFLNGPGNVMSQTHGRLGRQNLQKHDPKRVYVRFDSEHARLLVLGVDVAEGSGS
ncbi:hypothetical protein CR513_26234, partial [Mucuna pruriens]